MFLDKEYFDGWMQRLPVAVLRGKADYASLLPPDLPEPFTTADVKRASRQMCIRDSASVVKWI